MKLAAVTEAGIAESVLNIRKLSRILPLLTCYFTFEPISVGVCTVPAGVFN